MSVGLHEGKAQLCSGRTVLPELLGTWVADETERLAPAEGQR